MALPRGDLREHLVRVGLVCQHEGRWRTTRRWHGAMMRAARRLMDAGDPGDDLRVPMASAFVELFGDELSDDDIVRLMHEMLPLELLEAAPPGEPK
jgi:hypothetical protein